MPDSRLKANLSDGRTVTYTVHPSLRFTHAKDIFCVVSNMSHWTVFIQWNLAPMKMGMAVVAVWAEKLLLYAGLLYSLPAVWERCIDMFSCAFLVFASLPAMREIYCFL